MLKQIGKSPELKYYSVGGGKENIILFREADFIIDTVFFSCNVQLRPWEQIHIYFN